MTGRMPPPTLASRTFASLSGTWHLRRSLNSILPGFPSGVFEGTAVFTPRQPTAPSADGELLYSETGELKTDNGFVLKAHRKYIYRYNSDGDKISAWFVTEESKGEEGKEVVDYLFHDLEMEGGADVLKGRGEHLCSLDMYWAYYEFRPLDEEKDRMQGRGMDVFGVKYKVKGPSKDYTSDAAYERV